MKTQSTDSSMNPSGLSRRQFLRLSGGLGVALVASACVSATPSEAPAAESGSAAAAPSGEAVALESWNFFTNKNGECLATASNEWAATTEGKFTMSTRSLALGDLKRELTTALAASTAPDMMVVDNPDHAGFSKLGAYADLSDYISNWKYKDVYYPGPWNSTLWDGKNYGVPEDSNTLCLWINNAMAETAGLDVTKPPTSWDELKEWSSALTDESKNQYGIAFAAKRDESSTFQWLPFLWQNDGDISKLGDASAAEALQLWKDFVDAGQASREVVNYTQGDVLGQFQSGNAAMMINGPWNVPSIRDQSPDLKWTIAVLPYTKQQASALGGGNYAVFKTSKSVDACWSYIEYSEDLDYVISRYICGGRMPTRRDAADKSDVWKTDDAYKVFLQQMEYARPRGPLPNWPEVSDVIQVMIQEALTDQKTIEQATAEAAEKMSKVLEA